MAGHLSLRYRLWERWALWRVRRQPTILERPCALWGGRRWHVQAGSPLYRWQGLLVAEHYRRQRALRSMTAAMVVFRAELRLAMRSFSDAAKAMSRLVDAL